MRWSILVALCLSGACVNVPTNPFQRDGGMLVDASPLPDDLACVGDPCAYPPADGWDVRILIAAGAVGNLSGGAQPDVVLANAATSDPSRWGFFVFQDLEPGRQPVARFFQAGLRPKAIFIDKTALGGGRLVLLGENDGAGTVAFQTFRPTADGFEEVNQMVMGEVIGLAGDVNVTSGEFNSLSRQNLVDIVFADGNDVFYVACADEPPCDGPVPLSSLMLEPDGSAAKNLGGAGYLGKRTAVSSGGTTGANPAAAEDILVSGRVDDGGYITWISNTTTGDSRGMTGFQSLTHRADGTEHLEAELLPVYGEGMGAYPVHDLMASGTDISDLVAAGRADGDLVLEMMAMRNTPLGPNPVAVERFEETLGTGPADDVVDVVGGEFIGETTASDLLLLTELDVFVAQDISPSAPSLLSIGTERLGRLAGGGAVLAYPGRVNGEMRVTVFSSGPNVECFFEATVDLDRRACAPSSIVDP